MLSIWFPSSRIHAVLAQEVSVALHAANVAFIIVGLIISVITFAS